MCSQWGLKAAICPPLESSGKQVRCAASHSMVLLFFPHPQDTTTVDFQVACDFCFKEWDFLLCHISQRQVGVFSFPRAGPCDRSHSSSSLILTSSSWTVSRAWSEAEKDTIGKVFPANKIWKRKGLNNQTRSDKVEMETETTMMFWSTNYCQMVNFNTAEN